MDDMITLGFHSTLAQSIIHLNSFLFFCVYELCLFGFPLSVWMIFCFYNAADLIESSERVSAATLNACNKNVFKTNVKLRVSITLKHAILKQIEYFWTRTELRF